jgi:hypothetical protein
MMKSIAKPLLDKLIARNIITVDTEIDAMYTGVDMAGQPFVRSRGTFIVREIIETDGRYRFRCASVIDGQVREITDTAILLIDGMAPDRVAETYGMTILGEDIPPGRRRGRKPKAKDDAVITIAEDAEIDVTDAIEDDAEDEDEV